MSPNLVQLKTSGYKTNLQGLENENHVCSNQSQYSIPTHTSSYLLIVDI